MVKGYRGVVRVGYGTLGVSVFLGKGESIGALGLSGTFR